MEWQRTKEKILKLLTFISNNEDLKVILVETTKSAVITGSVTLIGGILLGPRGYVLGGVLGGGLASLIMGKRFKPVSEVISEMSEYYKDSLCRMIFELLVDIAVRYLPELIQYIENHPEVYSKILDILKSFVTTDLNMILKPAITY